MRILVILSLLMTISISALAAEPTVHQAVVCKEAGSLDQALYLLNSEVRRGNLITVKVKNQRTGYDENASFIVQHISAPSVNISSINEERSKYTVCVVASKTQY